MSDSLLRSLGLAAVAFAALYYPSFNRLARGLASPYAKADLGRRLSAAVVDGLLCLTIWVLFKGHASALYLVIGSLYLLVRDSIAGRSLGKILFGLVVIDLHTGRPCGWVRSITRNAVFALPGANLAALFLESASVTRDPQGQRLGDRLAQTQVVEGLGARDLASDLVAWWRDFISHLDGNPRKRRRVPVRRQAA
jgi:RDD family protein